MKLFIFAIAAFSLTFLSWKNLETNNKQGKWIKLFDGKTKTGWHTYGKQNAGAAWDVQENALHLNPQTKDGRGDLITDKEYTNFDLKLEWKISPAGNSGVIFLVHEEPEKYTQTYSTGLEMQVLDNIKADDNKKENHLAGTLYDLIGTAADSKPKPVGEWNKAEIIVNNGSLKLILNGTTVASTTMWTNDWNKLIAGSKFANWQGFASFKTGHIALQDHGHEVWYRNIEIKEL
ncbi:glycosyl hydrolase [Arachidicoccus ginsenosidimutans]|uniref:3-keto-disaccharide hydrolase n=1 Tax=Arachidicoccus sp. BS20 TaxID=1850526 RepID=UPI0007F16F65|nr:DUF1080 domain-containing protein [Arachidicoccus sp. BS20]ANI89729.1 glycosyl hydrolase [Arachidicoccus sp. BS20]